MAENKDDKSDDSLQLDDPVHRREIRSQYRSLIQDTQKNKEELTRPDSKGLHVILEEAEKLFGQVRHTREAALDSTLLVAVTNLGTEQARQLQTDFVTFEPKTYAKRLISYMQDETIESVQETEDNSEEEMEILTNLNWMKIVNRSVTAFKRVPKFDFMLGPIIIEPPPKKAHASRKKPEDKRVHGKTVPEQLDKVETQEEATTKEVERVHSFLKKCSKNGEEPVHLFEFIINPDSFGETVENMFHLSFLIKDGRASISLDDDGQPIVTPHAQYREEDYDEIIPRKQVIFPLNVTDWKEIVDVYDIKTSLIPSRKS